MHHRMKKDAPSGTATTLLEILELDGVVHTYVSCDEVPAGKPAPDVYLEACRRIGIDPTRSLAIEDSTNGARSAKAAGMTVVLVPNLSVPPAPGAHETAHHVRAALADVVALLEGAAPAGA